MAWVPDSSAAGYLGPKSSPAPLVDDAWEDFLHHVIAGVTDVPNNRVIPGWQENPPNWPLRTTDWVSFRVSSQDADWMPAIVHDPAGDGQDLFQRHETSEVFCTIYGPNASRVAGYLRDGLMIWQNQAALRVAGAALVEVSGLTSAPELFKQQWLNRVDLTVTLRREIRRSYPVLSILSAAGTVSGEGRGGHEVSSNFDTGDVP